MLVNSELGNDRLSFLKICSTKGWLLEVPVLEGKGTWFLAKHSECFVERGD